MNAIEPVIKRTVPEDIGFSVLMRPIIETANAYFGENPFFTEVNAPWLNNYDHRKAITLFSLSDAVEMIFNCLKITPELIYICRQPLNETTLVALQNYTLYRIEHLFMEGFDDLSSRYGNYINEVIEDGGLAYTDNYGNVVSIMYGITPKQSFYWNLLVFLFVREFITAFSRLTDYMVMVSKHEYIDLTPEIVYSSEDNAYTNEYRNELKKGRRIMLPVVSIYTGLYQIIYKTSVYQVNGPHGSSDW